jgi:hypothetical protein
MVLQNRAQRNKFFSRPALELSSSTTREYCEVRAWPGGPGECYGTMTLVPPLVAYECDGSNAPRSSRPSSTSRANAWAPSRVARFSALPTRRVVSQ